MPKWGNRGTPWRGWAWFGAGMLCGALGGGLWRETRDRLPPAPPLEPHRVRLALLQHDRLGPEPDTAMARLSKAVSAAFRLGATYVLLPELSFVGIRGLPQAQELSREIADCRLTPRLQRLARRYRGYVVFNHVVREGQDVFNASVMIGPSGAIKHIHRKTVLANVERRSRLAAGDAFATVETQHGRIGMLICREANDLLPFAQSAANRAEAAEGLATLAYEARHALEDVDLLLLQLAHAGFYDPDARNVNVTDILWHAPRRYVELATGWAQLTGAYVALINKSGPERNYRYAGHSCVVAPSGRLLGTAGYCPGFLLVDLPLDANGRIARGGDDHAFGELRKPLPFVR